MSERLNIKNLAVEPESGPLLDLESINARLKPFLMETFERWNFNVDQLSQFEANLTPAKVIAPEDIDYAAYKADDDAAKSGQYTLNPETAGLNFDTINPSKITIVDLASMKEKRFHEVPQYILDTYGATHRIPGLEYWQYLLEHPDKMPPVMKNDQRPGKYGSSYLFFGSLVCGGAGDWATPAASWDAYSWQRHAMGIRRDFWTSGCRAVLIERSKSSSKFSAETTQPLPNQRNF